MSAGAIFSAKLPRMQSPNRRTAGWLTLPNALSFARIAMAPLTAWAVITGRSELAMAYFVVAVVSDLADGPLARYSGQSSPVGMLLDHGADAIFVVTLGVALSAQHVLPMLLPIAIALAFVQYTLDSRVLAGTGFRPSRLGRWNGIAYFVVEGLALGALMSEGLAGLRPWVSALAWLLIMTTAISMLERAWWTWRTTSSRR